MKTNLECVPCFFRQLLHGARAVGLSSRRQKRILDEFSRRIPGIPLSVSPPEVARISNQILKRVSGCADPYKAIKDKSNRLALRLYGKLKQKVARSPDGLLAAVELAIAGNIIDFGAKNNLDVREELKKILALERKTEARRKFFHYPEFRRAVKKAKTILYIGDNAGEVVFDRVLIEEIKKVYPGKEIIFSVRGSPVINDVLYGDARDCGVNRIARVISNGSDAPGTILAQCSASFKRIYRNADMVISKGQGNFESLSLAEKAIFFLFMVKCPVVAGDTGCKMGEIVLLFKDRK